MADNQPMLVDQIRNPMHTTEQIFRIINKSADALKVDFDCDKRCVLLAFCENESSMGMFNFRYEPAYGLAGLYFRKSKILRELYDVYGPMVSMSYGPMQIMYATAYDLGYRGHPLALSSLENSIEWVIKYMNRASSQGAKSLKLLASSYNGGSISSWKTNPAVDQYALRIEMLYDKWKKKSVDWAKFS